MSGWAGLFFPFPENRHTQNHYAGRCSDQHTTNDFPILLYNSACVCTTCITCSLVERGVGKQEKTSLKLFSFKFQTDKKVATHPPKGESELEQKKIIVYYFFNPKCTRREEPLQTFPHTTTTTILAFSDLRIRTVRGQKTQHAWISCSSFPVFFQQQEQHSVILPHGSNGGFFRFLFLPLPCNFFREACVCVR